LDEVKLKKRGLVERSGPGFACGGLAENGSANPESLLDPAFKGVSTTNSNASVFTSGNVMS
jgi:hypothetical protein